MRLAFLLGRLNYGGGEKVASALAVWLAHAGADVRIFTFEEEITNDGADEIPIDKVPLDGLIGIKQLRAILAIKKLIVHNGINIIISFSGEASIYAIPAAKLARCRSVVSERVDPSFLPHRLSIRILRRLAYFLSDGGVFQTEKVKKYFGKFAPRHSVVIPNPLMIMPLPEVNEDTRKPEIIAVGRLSKEKGFHDLIEAFQFVHQRHPEYRLIIYGEGPEKESLKKRAEILGLACVVFLPGHKKNCHEEIAKAKIFVLPSYHEGMPNALIEALAVGTPVVSTDCPSGGPAYLTKQGWSGILVPTHDVLGLADGIESLLKEPAKRSQLMQRGLWVREELALPRIGERWFRFLLDIINSQYMGTK